jgi:hypothetical protein
MRTGDTLETFAVFEERYDEAADRAEPHDPTEVARFAERLNGLQGLDYDAVSARLADLTLPAGFVFVRFFEAATGEYFGGILSDDFTPIDATDILIQLVPDAEFDVAIYDFGRVWVGTRAMPVTKPGVLDLEIDYRKLN